MTSNSGAPLEDSGTLAADAAAIDGAGIRLPASRQGTFDVVFDGQRVWSIASADRRVDGNGVRSFDWPEPLRPYLNGFARVVVREHVTGEVVADEEVVFGSGAAPVRVVDSKGRPLAVTKWGRMNHPFENAGTEAVDAYLDQVDDVLAVLRDDCGLPAFLSYGSLLGAVREGKLIGHDVDVDLAYLSDHENPTDMMRESFRVERAFRRRQWSVRRENGGFLAMWFTQPDGGVRNIDVFTCFYVEGFLHQPHDVRARLPRSAMLPLGRVSLEGREFPAPADPPALLEATYGPTWRTPDPSFEYKSPPATVRRVRGWLGGIRDHRDYWNKTHKQGGHDAGPSAFAEWVHRREPREATFVDVGCGTGQDALALAQYGREALGLDYAYAGIRVARASAQEGALPARFWLCNLYDRRHVLAMGARLGRDDRVPVLYSRFVVEALEHHGRANLWRLAEMALRGGGRLYLEFRAGQDSGSSRGASQHIRHLLTSEAVAAEIRSRGGTIEHLQTDTEYDRDTHDRDTHDRAEDHDENDNICRLVANW